MVNLNEKSLEHQCWEAGKMLELCNVNTSKHRKLQGTCYVLYDLGSQSGVRGPPAKSYIVRNQMDPYRFVTVRVRPQMDPNGSIWFHLYTLRVR